MAFDEVPLYNGNGSNSGEKVRVPKVPTGGMASITVSGWVFAIRLSDLFQMDKWKNECKGFILLFIRDAGNILCNLRKETSVGSLILTPDIPNEEIQELAQLGIFDRRYADNPSAVIAELKQEFGRLEQSAK